MHQPGARGVDADNAAKVDGQRPLVGLQRLERRHDAADMLDGQSSRNRQPAPGVGHRIIKLRGLGHRPNVA